MVAVVGRRLANCTSVAAEFEAISLALHAVSEWCQVIFAERAAVEAPGGLLFARCSLGLKACLSQADSSFAQS